jgi:hypothetical protein
VSERSGVDRTERIQRILDELVRDRQALRHRTGVDASLLEANRQSIVYWQSELSHALLAGRGRGSDAPRHST